MSEAEDFFVFRVYLLIILAGKGMIMLLSGPPGVGKTLTAESGTFSQTFFISFLFSSASLMFW